LRITAMTVLFPESSANLLSVGTINIKISCRYVGENVCRQSCLARRKRPALVLRAELYRKRCSFPAWRVILVNGHGCRNLPGFLS
jgi:hypothetical protein